MDSKYVLLGELFSGLSIADNGAWCSIAASGIKEDSREIVPGDIFVARDGESFKGSDYIQAAIARGAVAALVEKSASQKTAIDTTAYQIPVIAIENMAFELGTIAAKVFHNVVAKLNIIGITGTNGKTSSAHYLAQALNSLGINTYIIGTLGNGHPHNLQQASRTTPDACSLQQLFAQFYASGAKAVVMEVSSHALEQGRVQGVPFNVVAYTNLSQDHLDYHGTMQAYAAAKAKLFSQFNAKHRILNLDDSYNGALYQQLQQNAAKTLTSYSETLSSNADFTAQQLQLSQGLSFELHSTQAVTQISSLLLGKFNVANLLLCIAVLVRLSFTMAQIKEVISGLKPVPGRMQKVAIASVKDQPLAIVDYAHTPDALEKALQASRVHTSGKLMVVFGCGGDRDTSKRALMAAIAERFADLVIVTSDNPRSENAHSIINMIAAGFSSDYKYTVKQDRKMAIDFAIKSAQAGDVVLVAGKGHEDYQEIMGVKQPFLDEQVVLEALTERHLRQGDDYKGGMNR